MVGSRKGKHGWVDFDDFCVGASRQVPPKVCVALWADAAKPRHRWEPSIALISHAAGRKVDDSSCPKTKPSTIKVGADE